MSTPEIVTSSVLQSSKNPNKLSLTIKGLLVTLVPVIVTIATSLGYQQVDVDFVNVLIDLITQIITAVTLLSGLLMTAWGLVRKLF